MSFMCLTTHSCKMNNRPITIPVAFWCERPHSSTSALARHMQSRGYICRFKGLLFCCVEQHVSTHTHASRHRIFQAKSLDLFLASGKNIHDAQHYQNVLNYCILRPRMKYKHVTITVLNCIPRFYLICWVHMHNKILLQSEETDTEDAIGNFMLIPWDSKKEGDEALTISTLWYHIHFMTKLTTCTYNIINMNELLIPLQKKSVMKMYHLHVEEARQVRNHLLCSV